MENKKESSQNPKLAFSLLGVVLVLWILSLILIPSYLDGWNNRGTFGDMFGAVNALFSGLAFGGLIYTIYLQSKELSLQREELEQTREELKGQKIQLEKQNENLTKQNFEITFFNMLKNLQSIVNNMVHPQIKQTGRIYLHHLFEVYEVNATANESFKSLTHTSNENKKERIREVVLKIYDSIFSEHSYNLGHYYRTIHNLLKLIEKEFESKEIRLKYASILQAQLSNDELGFILYNSLSDYSLNKQGKPEFRRMIDELNILENIDEKCVFDKSLLGYFPNTNFYFTRKRVV